jgi:hypothetical protein
LRKLADALDVEVADFFREPVLPKAEAPEAGHPSIVDIAWDAARRQVALEKEPMTPQGLIDQRHANEAMRRLREEHALEGNDAEVLVDFALRHARLEEEAAALRNRLQEREQAHS